MERAYLGDTGVRISRIILGCGNFGGIGSAPALFGRGDSREESFAIMDAAWEAGITTFDTADAYGGGRSETWIGDTAGALDELVGEGKVAAYGLSNVDGAQLREALAAGRFGWVQNSYSLLDRAAEDDVLPLCEEHGLGFTPFSPLAGGWLTGKYRRGEPTPAGSRMAMRPEPYEHLREDRIFDALERLAEAAHGQGTSSAALAIAWLLADPRVTAVIVGPRRPEHLEPALAALGLAPDRDRVTALFS